MKSKFAKYLKNSIQEILNKIKNKQEFYEPITDIDLYENIRALYVCYMDNNNLLDIDDTITITETIINIIIKNMGEKE